MSTLKVRSVLLDSGRLIINAALAGYSKFAAHSVRFGSAAGHEPSAARTSVLGAEVFSGGASYIATRILDASTVRYSVTLPEGVGPFSFGSLIIYSNALDGLPIPFIEIVFPFAVQKSKAEPILQNGQYYPTPGNRMVITIVVSHKHLQDGADGSIVVNVVAPAFSNPPSYPDDSVLPPASNQPWSQFVLHRHIASNLPAIVVKRDDNTHWATPMLQNLRHPEFGAIAGGAVGDQYTPSQHGWLWGHRYDTPENKYSGVIGGFGYDTIVPREPNVLGGIPY